MKAKNLISIDEVCRFHNLEISFIHSVWESGLIEIINSEETEFLDYDQLRLLERIMLFHGELNINLEGIETITHLLRRIEFHQEEIAKLKNRLRFYEEIE